MFNFRLGGAKAQRTAKNFMPRAAEPVKKNIAVVSASATIPTQIALEPLFQMRRDRFLPDGVSLLVHVKHVFEE